MNWHKYGIDITKVHGGKGICPKCHDSRKNKNDKSLSVNKETGLFMCHNHPCDFKGCAADKGDNIQRIKKDYTRPPERLEKLSPNIIKWFENRGISNDTLLRLKITEAIEWMPGVNKETKCICFNYYKDGELVNIKFRANG
jgi:twinkle protein